MDQQEPKEIGAPDQLTPETPTLPGVAGAEPPLEDKGAKLGGRHKIAAGFYSIYETAHYGIRDMGVKRSLQTLLKVNQKDGFDCPSCAWPDPDGKRKAAEFCENGVKAIASEATRARATPDFFAKHSIDEMLQHHGIARS